MSTILEDVSEPALAGAIEANLGAYAASFGTLPQTEFHEDAETTWVISGVPYAMLNFVVRAQFSAEEVDARIAATLARFRARRLPMVWFTGPSTRPADLGARLEAHGLRHLDDAPGMAIDLHPLAEEPPLPAGCTIERVGTVEHLRQWFVAVTGGFELPDYVGTPYYELYARLGFARDAPFRHYVGRLNGEPVATTSLFLAAGVAGIHKVSTVPQGRGRGIAGALVLTALREARALGYRVGILAATPLGLPVYRRLGFREYCRLGLYRWEQDGGLSPLDLAELPTAQRTLMGVLLHEGALSEAALRAAVGRLPAGERLSAADLDRALDALIGLNWLSRAEGPDPTYRVRFRPRRPRQYTAAADARAAGDLWATLV